MRITVFSDASFCHQTHAAGWGAWAKRDDWRQGQFLGGPIRFKSGTVACSLTAELAGIGFAIWKLKQHGSLEHVDVLSLQCDSVSALSLVSQAIPSADIITHSHVRIGRSSLKGKVAPMILKTIKEATRGIKLQLKHVKGHSGKRDGRSWVNDQCDREARQHMLVLRKEFAGLQSESAS